MADNSEILSSAKVRDLIFAYERHSQSTLPLEGFNERPRAKSIGNALSYKRFRQPNVEFHSMVDIEKELVKIEAHLNYYEVYEKETHVAFQEQLFNVLTSIVSIDPEDQEGAIQLKKKFIQETQKLATDLNSRLPYDGNQSYKGLRRTYSSYVRKEEAVVSTTSVKNEEHRAILSSQSSTLNGGYKSEESLNSTKDSLEISSKQDESSSLDLNYLEERPQTSTLPPQKKIVEDAQASVIPSVSRLKQFFSFRREAKPEVRVTSGSYSGITRSQSLNVKTSKYSVIKRDKNMEAKKKQESISENDEGIEKIDTEGISTSSTSQELHTSQATSEITNSATKTDSLESSLHIEPVKEIEEEEEQKHEEIHNVSVSKLKSLFEKNQSETNEGLGLLTKKQNEFSSDFNIPFTAMNLGAYRLKRTISGNYMNFTGLIRNVDISKKGDLSKSKSLSDLKITNFSYGPRDVEVDDDLSKEIDDDDDFVHVSIDVGKESKEVNNNVVENETSKENDDSAKAPLLKVPVQLRVGSVNVEGQSIEVSTSENSQTVHRGSETIYSLKSVESLKQTFENLSSSSGQRTKDSNEEIKNVLYKTRIEPVPRTTTVVVEPDLTVPLQLRTGHASARHTREVTETSNSTTLNIENNDDIKHVLHRTIGPILSTTDALDEPRLKVPIQLRTGFTNIYQSQEVSENVKEIGTSAIETKEDNVQQHQEEPVLRIPIQLRVGVGSTKENVEATETVSYNEETAHEVREELTSAQIVKTLKQTYENISSSSNSELSNEEIKPIPHRTIEPISNIVASVEEPVLKVPIQLRTGLVNVSQSHEITESSKSEEKIEDNSKTVKDVVDLASPGTVEILTQTFENISSTSNEMSNGEVNSILHRKIEPIPSSSEGSEEPVLKVPIQLRTGFVNISQSHTVTEDLKKEEEVIENNKVVEEVVELSSPGTVESLTQTFEIISSTSNEMSNEEMKSILHRTIEPISHDVEDSKEPVLKVPIQLRTGFGNISQSHEVTEDLKKEEEVIENSKLEDSKEPVLKVPIQLKAGFGNISQSHEVTEGLKKEEVIENNKVIEEIVESASPATVEVLTQTFENISSTGTSELSNEEIKQILYGTTEPIPDDLGEAVLTVPIQLRTGVYNVSQASEVSEHAEAEEHSVQNTSNISTSFGTVEELKETFGTTTHSVGSSEQTSERTMLKVPIEFRSAMASEYHSENAVLEHKTEISQEEKHIIGRSQSQETTLEVPIQLRVTNNASTTEIEGRSGDIMISTAIEKHETVPIVNVTSYSNAQDEAVLSEDGTISRARIEQKTESFMNILEAPTEFSTMLSSSSLSQSQHASSASKMSVSYSEKRTVQHTSTTQVSQRIISSLSSSVASQQSSQNYLHVLEEPISYSPLSSWNGENADEENTITITEVSDDFEDRRKPRVNLNVSQENIIEEILKEADSLENIDEEFEKMLQENTN